MAGPAVVASLASAGLGAVGSITRGAGEQASQEWQARRDERAAAFGRLRAEQVDVQLREEMDRTIANINVIRAAANADPFSPTAMAVKENEQRIADRERMIRVGSIRAQADEDEASARYRRIMGRRAYQVGVIEGLAGLGRAGAAAAGGFGTRAPAGMNSYIGDPTRIGALY